jgi:hypothetical protein
LDITGQLAGTDDPAQWVHVDVGNNFEVTQAMLAKPLMLRVESQADGGEWVPQERSVFALNLSIFASSRSI